MKRSYGRRGPNGTPLPAPSVYLVCQRSGRWVGDVLAPADGNVDVFLSDDACPKHDHVPPAASDIAGAVAEARRINASVPLRVNPAV